LQTDDRDKFAAERLHLKSQCPAVRARQVTALIGPLDPVGKPSGAPNDAKALTGYAPRP
jgi:hypothetical protein